MVPRRPSRQVRRIPSNTRTSFSLDPDYKPDRSYLKVSDPKWVRKLADFYFSAHPFSALQEAPDLLKHAHAIRNRVVHDSTKCKADFKATAIYFLQPANGHLKQGYGSTALLQAPVQRHFGQQAIQQRKTHFIAYCEFFRDMASKIVPPLYLLEFRLHPIRHDQPRHAMVTSVNVAENADGLEVATAQAALGGSCRVSLVGDGLSISPMASTPMERCCICHSSLASSSTAPIRRMVEASDGKMPTTSA